MANEKVIDLDRLDRYDAHLKTQANILQRDTNYSVGTYVCRGNIFLKCKTAGKTASTTLNLSNVAVGDELTDNTVTWVVVDHFGASGNGLNDWKSNTKYSIGDIFVYEGQIYKVLIDFTSSSTFENIEILEDYELQTGDIPIPWAEGTDINIGDIVSYDSKYYIALVEFTCGSIFTKNVFEEYVPKSLTDDDIDDIIDEFNPIQSGGASQTSGVPIGTVISFMGLTAPSDYLICDGTIYNITDYQALADHINIEFNSYNYFGGDGVTTFAVPDLRGEFLRGTGTNSHENQGSGANVGVHQDSTKHNIFVVSSTQDGNIQIRGVDGSTYTQLDLNNRDSVISTNIAQNFEAASNSGSGIGDGFYTSRPTNTSVLYCIKYK